MIANVLPVNQVSTFCQRGCSRYGWTGRPLLTKSSGWSWVQEAGCVGHGCELWLKTLTFVPPPSTRLYENGRKAFSFRVLWVLSGTLCSASGVWTPLGALPPDHVIGSRCVLAVVPSPLPTPGSAPVCQGRWKAFSLSSCDPWRTPDAAGGLLPDPVLRLPWAVGPGQSHPAFLPTPLSGNN